MLAAAAAGALAWYVVSGSAAPGDGRLAILAPKAAPTVMGWPVALSDIASGMSDPFGVVVDRKGNVYVADAGEHNRIVKIAPDGASSVLAGGAAEGFADGLGAAAAFHTPSALAIDREGNLLVADTGNNAIRKITPEGMVSTLAGGASAGHADGPGAQALFNGPVGVAVDLAGNVFVADSYNDRIRKIAPGGMVSTVAGGAAPGFADGAGAAALFDTPTGLALDVQGNLYIADSGNGAVRKLDAAGMVGTLAQTDPQADKPLMRRPVALAVTGDGYLYIGDMSRGRILQLSPAGELRGLTGVEIDIEIGDAKTPRLGRLAGMALDRDGTLYVTDASRRMLRRAAARGAPARAAATPLPNAPAPLPAAAAGASFPWPFAPQDRPHEVVGIVGEVRGSYDGESRHHFHNGLDVQAAMGVPVLAVANEKVSSPLPNSEFDGVGESLGVHNFAYVHMRVGRTVRNAPLDPARFTMLANEQGKPVRVRVKRGTRFQVGDPVGTVNRMFHVHLIHRTAEGEANPLALPLPGLSDLIVPRIDRIELHDLAGKRLDKKIGKRLLVAQGAGPLSIVVDAWDQADGNAARRKLGLYKVGYQLLDAGGTPLPGFEKPRINIEFNRLPPDQESVKVAYAENSGITVYGSKTTRFLYTVTNSVRDGAAATGSWDPNTLAPGDYTIRILAADYAGNEALSGRDLAITVQ